MKKVLLIVAAILLANAVSAQNHEKNILGVRAGLNLSSYSISESGVSVSTDSRPHSMSPFRTKSCSATDCLSTSKPDSPFRAAAANYPE